ncbi:MAG: adenylate/guanylate cyclase domain-containing protein [Proteobacteria bacterium]|nr:adenylate/guanylate cyclase domain-containing protein [Pseudomonadota bacterium]
MPINLARALLHPTPFKAGFACIIACCFLWYSFGYEKPSFFSAIDARIVDAMFQVRGVQATTNSVVIVDIDEKSLKEQGQWPWPRNIVADLTQKIYDAGALVLGFDILFAEKDRTSPAALISSYKDVFSNCGDLDIILKNLDEKQGLDHDRLLGDTIASGTSVLGYMFLFREDFLKTPGVAPFPSLNISIDKKNVDFSDLKLIRAYRPILNISEISTASSEGFFNVFPDQSGTVRKVPLFIIQDNIPYPSLAFEMVRLAKGEQSAQLHLSDIGDEQHRTLIGVSLGNNFIRTDDLGHLTVNFRGPYNTFRYLSATNVLKGVDKDILNGKYVLIGSSATGIMDLVATPFSSRTPGVEVHANVIDNLIKGDAMAWENYTEIGLTYFIIIVAGLLLVISLVYLGPFLGFSAGLVILAAIVIGNYQLLFLKQQLLGISYILSSLLTVFMTVSLFNYFSEGRRRLFIRRAFSHYVSPSVVNELLKNPEKLNLSVESREVTIMFCDIRNFTTLSEVTPATELGQFLNQYFSLMTDIILKHNGMVDKYIGDAIMAIWGTPLDDQEHAANAVRAALDMVEAIKPSGSPLLLAGKTVDVGIGINTGFVSAGNFGSSKRFDYTVLGDNVNLASRIEGLTKFYHTRILISEFTAKVLPAKFCCRFIDKVMVKGRNRAVDLFEPLLHSAKTENWEKEQEQCRAAFASYRAGQFAEALSIFNTLQKQNPQWVYEMHSERCRTFLTKPPPADWQGVHDHN